MTLDALPNTIDSTMLADFDACKHKYWERFIVGLVPMHASPHLIFGGALAAGLAAARQSFYIAREPRERAEARGLKALIAKWGDFPTEVSGTLSEELKTLTRCVDSYIRYLDQYPLGQDPAVPIPFQRADKQGIETPFCLPIPGAPHPRGGLWHYTGRLDMFCRYRGARLVTDEKTGTKAGDTWPEKWDMRGQFIGYTWAAQQLGVKADGVLVRGVIIRKYDTTEFPHVVKTYAPWEVEEWLEGVREQVAEIERRWDNRRWRKSRGNACTAFNRACEYTPLCKSRDEALYHTHYRHERWDPLMED